MTNSFTPFTGFPPQSIDFLANLAANNDRAWFESHKEEYQQVLLEPAQAFVRDLGEQLQTISDAIRTDDSANGSGVLMRIHRDTRFSKDKSPYKTNISGMFWAGAKKTTSPAFGFQLEATGMALMGGIFKFTPPMLTAYRAAVQAERTGQALVEILATLRAAGDYRIAGEHYKRVPQGFDSDHPRADLLRHDGLYASPPSIDVKEVNGKGLVDLCYAHFHTMAPLFHWLRANTVT